MIFIHCEVGIAVAIQMKLQGEVKVYCGLNIGSTLSASVILTLEAVNFFYIIQENKELFSIWNNHKCLSYLFTLHLITYVMRPHPLYIFNLSVRNRLNPLTAKLKNRNFHPLEVVSRWRDPQLQVCENNSDLTKWRSTVFKYCWLMSYFIFNMFKRL